MLQRAAEPFPTGLGTLDAIHLASALLVREQLPDLVVATHDRELAVGARSVGFGSSAWGVGLAGLEWLVTVVRGEPTWEVHEGVLRMWATHQAELLGDAPAALANARRVHELTRSLGTVGLAAAGHYLLGVAHAVGGDSREAVDCFERAAAMYQEGGGGPPVELLTLASRLGVAYAELGQSQRALDAAARGLAVVRALRMPVFAVITLLIQAQVLRKTQGSEAREAIEAALTEAEALVASTGIRGWQPFLHVERAELAGLVGNAPLRERELREAHRLYVAMGATGHAERVAKALV